MIIRSSPEGTRTHQDNIHSYIQSVLFDPSTADIVFVCRDKEHVWAHKSILLPVSSLLRALLAEDICCHCHRKSNEPVRILLEEDSRVLKTLLRVLYLGQANTNTSEVTKLLTMLGIGQRGDFQLSPLLSSGKKSGLGNSSGAGSSSITIHRLNGSKETPAASSSGTRIREPTVGRGCLLDDRLQKETKSGYRLAHALALALATPSASAAAPTTCSPCSPPPLPTRSRISPELKRGAGEESSGRTEGPTPAKKKKVSALEMNIIMAQMLKDQSFAECCMENCTTVLTMKTLTEHFKKHYHQEEKIKNSSQMTKPKTITREELSKLGSTLDSSDEEQEEKATNTTVNRSGKRALSEPRNDPPYTTIATATPAAAATTAAVNVASMPAKLAPIIVRLPKPQTAPERTTTPSDPLRSRSKSPRSSQTSTKSPGTGTPRAKSATPGGALTTDQCGGSSSASAKRFNCQLCTRGFSAFRKLRSHYTLHHYWESLERDLKSWGSRCSICLLEFPSPDYLVQHMGNFHNYVDKYLLKNNFLILNREKTMRVLDLICSLCGLECSSSTSLKGHIAVKHFKRQLEAEFPIKNKKCPKCSKTFEQKSTIVSHIGSFHDEVLKYAQSHLVLDPEDRSLIPVDDFDDGVEGVSYGEESLPAGQVLACQKCQSEFRNRTDLKNHYVEAHYKQKFQDQFAGTTCCYCDQKFVHPGNLHRHLVKEHCKVSLEPMLAEEGIKLPRVFSSPTRSPKKPRAATVAGSSGEQPAADSAPSLTEAVFTEPVCKLCQAEVKSVVHAKKHYLHHFRKIFQEKYFTFSCPMCTQKFSQISDTQLHISTIHSDISLLPLINALLEEQRQAAVADASSDSESEEEYDRPPTPSTYPSKKCDIRLRKGDAVSRAVVRAQLDLAHTCDLPTCCEAFLSRRELLRHLLQTHFWSKLSAEYAESFSRDSRQCPICRSNGENQLDGSERAYLMHLALEHEQVMKFVQAAVGEMAGPRLASRASSHHSDSEAGTSSFGKASKSTMASRTPMASKSTSASKSTMSSKFTSALKPTMASKSTAAARSAGMASKSTGWRNSCEATGRKAVWPVLLLSSESESSPDRNEPPTVNKELVARIREEFLSDSESD